MQQKIQPRHSQTSKSSQHPSHACARQHTKPLHSSTRPHSPSSPGQQQITSLIHADRSKSFSNSDSQQHHPNSLASSPTSESPPPKRGRFCRCSCPLSTTPTTPTTPATPAVLELQHQFPKLLKHFVFVIFW